MSEPTAEQVEAERALAHKLCGLRIDGGCSWIEEDVGHGVHCTAVADALARVRKEALAAGRDEGLREAKTISDGQREILKQRYGDYGWLAADDVSDAIRALRGRG